VSDIKSEVSYLQGLSAGLNLDSDAPESKMFAGILGVLEKMAGSFDELEKTNGELEDYLETVDEDLSTLKDRIYGKEENSDTDNEFLEVECPSCGETVCFDADILEDEETVEIICPNCEKVVFVNDDNLQSGDELGLLEEKAAGKAIEEDI